MEIGNWIDGESNTGRIIHIPNGRVFTDNIENVSVLSENKLLD